jgi:hypothetical protein
MLFSCPASYRDAASEPLFRRFLTRVVPYKHWMEKVSRKQTILSSNPRGVTAWSFLEKKLHAVG